MLGHKDDVASGLFAGTLALESLSLLERGPNTQRWPYCGEANSLSVSII